MPEKMDVEGGIFKTHHSKLLSSTTDKQLKIFAALVTDGERFKYVHKLPIAHELDIKLNSSGKSGNVAFQVKERGNKAFKSGDYLSALQLYSKCILKTPWEKDSSRELAVALANRSAAMYHLQLHQAALNDIDLVLTLDYPAELRFKILDRKARCLLALKQLKDALEAFRATMTALDLASFTSERRQKWQRDIQIMMAMLNKNNTFTKDGLPNEPLPSNNPSLPPVTGGRNPRYHSASTSVTVKQTPEMGRFAEASNDVKVGDTLLVEKAHCAVLLEEHCTNHCYHCFKKVLGPVPCTQCSNVAFCSIKCQQEALSTHHGVECAVLPVLWSSGASITCHMALRILTQHGLKYFLDNKDKIEQSKEEDIKKYHGSDYLSVYHLVRHENKRTPVDNLQRADMAVFLYRCLKLGGFFGESISKNTEDVLTEAEVFIGGLLLRHLQSLQFNAHEISELLVDKLNKTEPERSVFLGGGLYPTLALFNHSCDPGVTRYFCGTSVVVRAVKNIEQGEMIAENYGPIFTQRPRSERQRELKEQYWFDCNCMACLENWPLFQDMDPTVIRFRCDAGSENSRCNNVLLVPVNTDQFMAQCKLCKEHTNILKGLKALQDTDAMFRLASRMMDNDEFANALPKFVDILCLLGETLAPPFRDYHLCQQAIRKCMLGLGNKTVKS